MVDDARAVDVRRHFLAIVLVVGGSENQTHPDALRDFDRLQDAFALGEAAEEEQVVVRFLAEREVLRVDTMKHGGDDVQAAKKVRLLVRDGDERRLGISRPQCDLRFAG